ncbi:HAMP domain-containing protein [Actinotalea sp. BY-33]|uniref:histidine kinase n=1 Tax=Actinotalea soli TaxID=2819234 RepID=A0A939LSS4_9CELL|nr:ATP-binding protein [Actinotalea soli]MBO1752375.1 HAMP domain-containing protein [Actinotalea soli]
MPARPEEPAEDAARPAGRRRPLLRRRPTVRARFLGAVLALSALGLTIAGVTAYGLQLQRVDAFIDESLTRNVEEFRALAQDGVDPATGTGFAAVEDLLYVALQRTVPATQEGMLAVVDGRVTNVAPTTVRLRLEEDPELLVAAIATPRDQPVTIRSITTSTREYRFVVVPVTVVGDESEGVLLLAFDRQAEHALLVQTYRTYAWVSLAALAVTAVVGWAIAGRLLAPIRLLRRTAQQITDTDLSARIPVTGDDDLSDLTRTVNAMLDRLEGSFASQRRLLDDAGHELRTPLTIIRGHLELVDPQDPTDIIATQALVVDEVDRMHRVIDDLVVLATADRPDFVRPESVDVGRLTDEVFDKVRTLGDHRWRVEARADVDAVLDPQRVTQALVQLGANAVKFAPAGTTVRLGSQVVADRLVLTVTDEGPGIPEEHAERVFERFARGRVGRGVEGSGLGLSIVRAIAEAHGGTATVDPRHSPGARLVIDLPWEHDLTLPLDPDLTEEHR